ncbi:MAG: type II toxin-antitoxin system HicB family antitoxin [Aggregatilineales bacterium]
MSQDLAQRARQLAAQPYQVIVRPDQTTNGEPVFIAYHNELEYLVAQGDTPEEALGELNEMRFEFILWLLEDGLPVPPPQPPQAKELLAIVEQLQALPDASKPTPDQTEAQV